MLKQKTSPFHLVPHLRYPLSPTPLTLSNLSPFHLDPHLWYPISPLHPVCERSLDPPVFTDTVYFYVFPVPLILTVKKKNPIHQTWRDGFPEQVSRVLQVFCFFLTHLCCLSFLLITSHISSTPVLFNLKVPWDES